MSGYDVEHDTPDPSTASQAPRRRRPDMSSFFSILREITPAPEHRPHAVPVPGDVSAAFLQLADAFDVMRRDRANEPETDAERESAIDNMIQILLSEARSPPREVQGVSEEFCDALERVPKSSLDKSQLCPICNIPFLEDEYPLVVQLPCHSTHLFDLECVRPWLRLRGTCPLDRVDFAKQGQEKKEELRRLAEQDEEEEWDGMYG